MAATIHRNPRIPSTLRFFCAGTANTAHELAPPSATLDDASISRIKTFIRDEPNPDRLAELFHSAATTPLFYGDRIIFNLAIRKLILARRPDLIERLLEHQLTDPSTPKSEGFLMRIISLYGNASMPDHAASAFDRISSPRSDRSLCALLNALLKSGQHARLRDTFDKAEELLGVSPGIASCNVLLRSMCEDGKVADASALFDEMPKRGLTPDIISYNMVLHGYLKEGNQDGFDSLLKELSRRKLEPNVTTYNCRMASLCRRRKSFQAEDLLDVMLSRKIRPNRVSFNTLIDGFCKEGDASSAMRVYRRLQLMKNEDNSAASANFRTYVVLLCCLVEKGEFDSAFEICKLCLNIKWAPPFVVVKDLLQGLIKNSMEKKAKVIVNKMRQAVKGDAIDAWKKIEGELSFEF
ncbi:hypothetical protein HPP92_012847 [Vanilla planifolia]|uniref:Pentatricopeptide repeat-containing protein n=1 Tax=Vanilla planifolia TaxID=51239 RepID=A0A835UY25_VANPL|nr:hypothetical protein HPP92_012847 [Vanilla planifolia]